MATERIAITVCIKIDARLTELSKTRSALARHLGKDRAFVTHALNEHRNWRVSELEKIAEFCNCEIGDFL